MADLQAVNYSLTGEAIGQNNRFKGKEKVSGVVKYPVEKNEKGEIKKGAKGEINITYPKEKEWYLFKLVDNTKKGGVYIPNVDDVMNPETGKVERARLLAGVSSIWVKDQKDLTPEYIRQNGRSIEFPRGHKILRVAAHDEALLYYARLCNSNIGNPLKVKSSRFEFFEYDSAAAEQEAFLREEFEFEMESLARAEKLESMKKHAAFLGIRLVTETGEPKTEAGIRREYARYAKSNPAYFKQTRGTDQIEISWLVSNAISEGLIDIGREMGKAFWANGGGMIGVFPQTDNAQDYLTNLAMTNSEEGKLFKDQLKQVNT